MLIAKALLTRGRDIKIIIGVAYSPVATVQQLIRVLVAWSSFLIVALKFFIAKDLDKVLCRRAID